MINFQKIFQNYPVFSMYISIIVIWYFTEQNINPKIWGHHDRMVIGFTTTYAISAYHH